MVAVRLTDINVPLQPFNEAIAGAKKSPRMRQIVEHIANTGVLIYQAKVAKVSAELARSARAFTEIGGVHHDSWVGVITVGEGVDHGLAHEDGRGDHPRSIKNLDGTTVVQHPAHDLNFVLEHLGEFS